MSHVLEPRRILHLPTNALADSKLLVEKSLRDARHRSKRFIPSLYQIVNVCPELTADVPLPEPFNNCCSELQPLYYLSPASNQPVVWNGFVWSYRADGSHHTVQHFVEGADILGGRPPRIFNGQLNMHVADNTILVCRYVLGTCISVSSRRSDELKHSFLSHRFS